MSLSEIMSNADLTLFPKVALVLFLGAFVSVGLRVLTLNRWMDVERASRMALDDDAPATAAGEEAPR